MSLGAYASSAAMIFGRSMHSPTAAGASLRVLALALLLALAGTGCGEGCSGGGDAPAEEAQE